MQITNGEPTNVEILEAVNKYASSIDGRFDKLEGRFDRLDERLGSLEAEVKQIKETMATKEDLAALRTELKSDLGKLRSDIIDFIDKKFFTLTDILIKKGIVSQQDVKAVFGIDPLVQTA